MRSLAPLVVLLACCSHRAEQGTQQPQRTVVTDGVLRPDVPHAQLPPSGPPSPISRDVLHTVCSAAPCGGDAASVEVLRDSSNHVRRLLRQYGACFHSPGIYFDETGHQTELIPNAPVTIGSPEQLALQARHDAQTTGLTHGETIRCRDGTVVR